MADRDLRRLSRRELIEIVYALKEREEALTKENEDLRAALSDRKIAISRAGSIAEAALALNDIFAQAQAAADMYLASVRAAAEAGTLEPTPVEPQESLLPEDWTLPPLPDPWEPEPTEEAKRRQRFTTRLSGLIQYPAGRKLE